MKSKKKDLDGPRDIISGLHDTLICHILSFLPTREAASTSVLAKRWKHLFAFVPNLDFDEYSFSFHNGKWRESSENFLDFVDCVLALQTQVNAPVNRFHLRCRDVVEAYWLLNWIDNVLKRGVSDLDLYISSPWPSLDSIYYLLPSEMYVSKILLVRLKIRFRGGVFIKVLDDVSLPKLKTLHLDWLRIEKHTFNKLLFGCRAHEELVLVNLKLLCDSWQPKPLPVTMSIPTLKRLTLSRFEDYSKSVFDIPNLVYLEYSATNRYQQMSFDSLVEARLSLQKSMEKTNETNLLTGIRNVKILYLSDDTLEVLAHCREIIPVFNNLLHLTITTLLKKCPNLQTLVLKGLHHIYTNICEKQDWCLCKYQDVRTCLSSSPVKVQKILKFGKTFNDDDNDTEKHIEQVKKFIETMPNLEQLILYYNIPNITNDEDVIQETSEAS